MANQPQQPDTALHNASHLMQYHDLIESIVAPPASPCVRRNFAG